VAASERLLTAIREVRAVLAHLLPPGLEELGLADALRTRLDSSATEGIATTVAGELPRLEPWVEQALYGMTSEAVSNAVRHGRPASLRVELGVARGRAVIRIADDGHGFDLAAVTRTEGGGLGLLGLSRQASWLGGSATVLSRPGAGTTVRISIPLERHRRHAASADATPEPNARLESRSVAAGRMMGEPVETGVEGDG
jgi:two-component system sensor histidine kinase UhpB